jgi:hypothetical protein
MEDEANTNTYEDEHLKVISLFAFTSGAKFGSQMWRLKVREKESHDRGWRAIACSTQTFF